MSQEQIGDMVNPAAYFAFPQISLFNIYSHLQPAEAGGELAGATGDHSSNGKIGRFLSTKRKTQGKLRKPTGRCFSGFSESLTVLYNVLDARDY